VPGPPTCRSGDFAPPGLTEPAGWVPTFDFEEQGDSYIVEAVLPGVKREDVNTAR
jgi:HSP20 family molecular chaperone IbpA